MYAHTVRGERFVFPDLRTLFAKANEAKAGDALAGIIASSERERVAAKCALADVPLAEIVANPVIDPDADDVSRLVCDSLDDAAFAPVRTLTVGEFREHLLDDETDLAALHRGVTPEVAAAVARLMGNKELVAVAARIRTVTRCRNTMGGHGVFGVRVQPNHPTDDPATLRLQFLVVAAMTASQALVNHLGIRVTRVLTDFSGWLILVVSAVFVVVLLSGASSLDLGRLVRFDNVLPTALGLIAYGRSWTHYGPWTLGRWYRPLAMVSVLACCGLFVIGVQPPNDQALSVVGGMVVVLLAVWFTHARKAFPGPPAALLHSLTEGKS